MQSKATTVEAYLASLTEEQRDVIGSIDSLVKEIHPRVSRGMKYGMPTYDIGGRMFACNAQKNYFSVYADPDLVNKYKADLQGLSVGQSCIRFASRKKMPEAVIRKLLQDYTPEANAAVARD